MILHFEADSVAIEVIVRRTNGDVLDLTGGSVEVVARKKNGAAIPVEAQILTAAEGKIFFRLQQDQFRQGEYRLQVRVALGADRQTVVDDVLTIAESIRVPA